MSGSDLSLLQRWHSHADAEAFKEITRRHATLVYAICCRVLGNAAAAEEVAQECFETLAHNKKLPKGSLGAWLHRMATNRALDRIKTEGRRRVRERQYAAERVREAAIKPEWDDIYEQVDGAIAELPEELCTSVVAHFLEDRTHAEIAEDLGVSRQTVTYRIGKAIEAIRKSLRKRGVEVTATALTTMFGANLTDAAPIPMSLSATLGKVALSGAKGAAVSSTVTLSGVFLFKGLVGVTLIAAVGLGLWNHFTEVPVEPNAVLQAPAPPIEAAIATEPLQETGGTTSDLIAPVTDVLAATAPVENEGAIITGKVYNKVTGKGLSGIPVIASSSDPNSNWPSRTDQPKSNARGEYCISGLKEGQYRVSCGTEIAVIGEDGSPGDGLRLGKHNSYPKFLNVVIERGTPVSNIDFALNIDAYVQGRITHHGNTPTDEERDQSERWRNEERTIVVGKTAVSRQSAMWAQGGRFIMEGFAPSKGLYLQASTARRVSAPSGPHTLTATGLSGIELVLMPEGRITGRLVDHAGAPKKDTPVMARTDLPQYALSRFTRTDAHGKFVLENLHEGHFDLCVNGPGTPNREHRTDGAIVLKSVDLRWGQSISRMVLKTVAEANSGTRNGTIRGSVSDTDGKPIANAQARLWDPRGKMSPLSVQTDAAGKFTLENLVAGSYGVSARHPEFSRNDGSITFVETGERADIILERRGRISGRIVDAESNQAIQAFEVGWGYNGRFNKQSKPDAYLRMQDEHGGFAIEGADAGSLTVFIRAEGYIDATEPVHVEEGKRTENIVVALDKGAHINGVVVDSAGNPIDGASIFFASIPRPTQREDHVLTRTDNAGEFSLQNVPPNTKIILASHEELGTGWVRVEQPIGNTKIILTPGGTVHGVVTGEGVPLVNAEIEIVNFGALMGMQDLRTQIAGRGTFEVSGILPGIYTVVCRMERERDIRNPSRSLKRVVEIQDGLSTEIVFDFPPVTAAIEGLVLNHGLPTANAFVTATVDGAAGEETGYTTTNEDGHFLIERLPEGDGRITVTASRGARLETGTLTQHANVELRLNKTTRQDFEFSGDGTLSGIVHSQQEKLGTVSVIVLPGAQDITWSDEEEEEALGNLLDGARAGGGFQRMNNAVAGAVVLEDGTFRIEGLDAGTYTILSQVMKVVEGKVRFFASPSQVVEVAETGKTVVELDLR